MSDTLNIWGVTWYGVNGFKANDEQHTQLTYTRPNGTITITSNGTVNVSQYENALVDISASFQNKTVSPTELQQTVTPDDGYNALSSVVINPISSTYVGSEIPYNPTPTVSANVVTIPYGFYSAQTTKSVSKVAQAVPSISIDNDGLITATAVQSSGYVNAGTREATHQLTTVSGTTIEPLESEQIAVLSNVYTTGQIKVGAISSTYVGSDIPVNPTPTASGAIVTIPYGYYSTQTTKSVATATHSDPTVSIDSVTGLITASHTQSAGYTNGGTTTDTLQLTVKNANVIEPTEYSQTAVAANVYTTGAITVDAIPSDYVGSAITRRTEVSVIVDGSNITVPSGYYSTSVQRAVETITLPDTTDSSAASGYTSIATISHSVADQYINIDSGYSSTNGYYLISGTPNGTVVAPSSISGSAASVSTGTNTLTLTKTISVTPNVSAPGYISSGTATNSSVSLTANVTTKAATTYNTSANNQTIASGTYLTGAQTIRGVTTSGISAANIRSGVTVNVGDSADADRIIGVTGTYTSDATATATDIVSDKTAYVNGSKVTGTLVIQSYYTGSGAPSSSLGQNGDIYLQS